MGRARFQKMIWVITCSRPVDMSKVFCMIHKIVIMILLQAEK